MNFLKSLRYVLGGLFFSQSVVHSNSPLWIGLLGLGFAGLVFGVQAIEIRRRRDRPCEVQGCAEEAVHTVMLTARIGEADHTTLVRLCAAHDPRRAPGVSVGGSAQKDRVVH